MGDDKDLQAAEWLSRLRTRSLANADLADFARWRRLPGSAEAYQRAERLWKDAGHLGSDPDVLAAVGRASRPRRWRLTPFLASGAAAAAGALVLVGMPLLRSSDAEQRYRTAVGERSSADLADGSRLNVDADSEVRVRLGDDERRVDVVRGQALFAVRSDAARPFVVTTSTGVSVRALGTRFAVEAQANGGVTVALLEGSVAVTRFERPVATLSAGESLLVGPDGSATRRRDMASEATDWTRGRLVFRDATLLDAVAEINRYARPSIEVSSRSAAGERVSGEFSVDDPDGFVRGINALLGTGTVERRRGG